jgi:endoglycosylceramidase
MAALTAVLVSPSGVAAGSGSPPRYSVDPPFVRDGFGRVVFFHGVNAVWKLPPYYPPSRLFGDAKSYFDQRDGRWLAANGFNNVRLGVLFAGVEPKRGVFDASYLDHIQKLVEMLRSYGVTVLLDFHQDMYNEKFQGEGFPAWSVIDDGLPATNCCGFPGNYFTPTLMHVFDNLWANRNALWDQYTAAWRFVASRLGGESNVMGYDLLNEPWPGSQWPSCAQPAGCPAFDTQFLQPFFEHVIAGIRSVDPHGIAWWEPNVTNDFGAANDVGLGSPIADSGHATGISFHDYCLIGGTVPGVSRNDDPACPTQEDITQQRQREAAARNHSALLMTEFGASDDLGDLARVTALADKYMVSWDYWAYGGWSDPTGPASSESMWNNDLDRPGSLKQPKASLLIRTYPQAVAGTPVSFAFHPERTDKEFTLEFKADPSIHAPTVIFVPVTRHYPNGYKVKVDGPAVVTSVPNAPTLTLRNTGSGVVTVTVTTA